MFKELLIEQEEEELLEELEWCEQKINDSVREFDRNHWKTLKRFYELLIEIKKSGIHLDEPLIKESDSLFRKPQMMKISAESSSAMTEAAVLMLERLVESRR